ncbi:hypothetical protein Tco_0538440 [Tanacetum coccineum]
MNTIFNGVECCKVVIHKKTWHGYIDPVISSTIETNFDPSVHKLMTNTERFFQSQKEEMVVDLKYFNYLENEIESLQSQLETQRTQFLNEIDQLSREYYYADHMNAILDVYTKLDEVTNLQCDYLEALKKCQKQIKNDKAWKQKESSSFRELNDKFFKIQDLKAQLQDKNIAISELKKLIDNMKGKPLETKTKEPIVVPISTREPKRKENQSVVTPHKKTVTLEPTIKKPKSTFRKLYEHVSKTCSWWYPKTTQLGYKWEPNSKSGNVNKNVSMPLGIESRTSNILDPKTVRNPLSLILHCLLILLQLVEIILFIIDSGCSKHMMGNIKLLVNFVEKFFGMVKFGNDQFALILGYRDMVQGNVTIKMIYYVEGLNHNLFFVGQFCDIDLEVAFWKYTCYVRDLKEIIFSRALEAHNFLNKTLHEYFSQEDSVMSDSDESRITYTKVSSPFEGLSDIGSARADDHEYLELPGMPEDPYVEAALQASPSPDYVPGLKEPEQAPPSPDYVLGPEHTDDEIVAEDQPDAEDASPTAQSLDYVPESDPEVDLEEDDDEDPEEDPIDYSADGGDDGDDEDESSEEDEDDEVDMEADEDEEEEEHPAPADSVVVALPATDQAPSAEETEPFKTDEYAATPPPHPAYRVIARISIPAPVPMPVWSDAEIPSPSLLLLPPSPVLSPAPPPSPIRSLGYRATMIWMRAEVASTSHSLPDAPSLGIPPPLPISVSTSSPPLLLPSASRREDIPEVTLPLRKRLGIALGPRYEVRESSSVAAARPARGLRADYGFVATMDREIRHDPER